MRDKTNMPVIPVDTEFGGGSGNASFQQGDRLKCTDGAWTDGDGVDIPVDTTFIAMGSARANRHLEDGRFTETIPAQSDEELADITELNAAIDRSEWPISDITGEPLPPWSRWVAVYLLDPDSGRVMTFSNNTFGSRLAVESLESRVTWMRRLRGPVYPLLKLSSTPMRTRYGKKMRPSFNVIEWRSLGGEAAITDAPAPKQLPGKAVSEPSTEEMLDDEIPFLG